MAQCPQCNSEIELGFGIAQCPHCQHLLVGDFDGGLEAETAPIEPPPAAPDLVPIQSTSFDPLAISNDPTIPTVPPLLTEENPRLDPLPDETADPMGDHWLFPETAPVADLPPSNQDAETVISSSPADLSEIAQYGNSDVSTGREGFLLFDLIIEGIDSGQTLNNLREVLGDPRFLLNVDRLVSSIKMGSLRIPALSPVKASLLVNRLKEYPLEIRWEQYAITRPKNISQTDSSDSL